MDNVARTHSRRVARANFRMRRDPGTLVEGLERAPDAFIGLL
jgi:NADPH-dependent curcumin reductase CurA